LAAIAGVVVALVVREFSRPGIRGDGIGYYAPVASILLDHDLDLRNEFAHSGASIRRKWLTLPDGRLVNPYPIGAAVLWSPAVWIARTTDPAKTSYLAPGRWQNASPGFSIRYVATIAIATALEALLGAWLLYRACRRYTGHVATGLAVSTSIIGTPVVYYALAEPSYAHTASFMVSAAFLAAACDMRRGRLSMSVLGILWGLAALVRYQDAVLGVLAAPRLWTELRAIRQWGVREFLLRLALFVGPAILMFMPQMLYWQRFYGQPLVLAVPSGFMHWARPAVLEFLFSTWHGALIWSPLLAVGTAGIAFLPDRGMRWTLWSAVALEVYTSAAAGDWWGSASFGARRLVVIVPIVGLGTALIVDRLHHAAPRARLLAAAGVVTMILLGSWNLRLAQYYVRGYLPKNAGNPTDYMRDLPAGHPYRRPWGHWDYSRLVAELVGAERRMWGRPDR
jgi:hypothetical protein